MCKRGVVNPAGLLVSATLFVAVALLLLPVQSAGAKTYVLQYNYSSDAAPAALYKPSIIHVSVQYKPWPPYKVLKKLHWKSWGSAVARATGTLRVQGAGGGWRNYPTTVKLSRPAMSGDHPIKGNTEPVRFFTRLSISTRPLGGRHEWSWSEGWRY